MFFLRSVTEKIQIVKIQSVQSADLSCSPPCPIDVDAFMIWRFHGHDMSFAISCYSFVMIVIDSLSDPIELIIFAKPVKSYGLLRIYGSDCRILPCITVADDISLLLHQTDESRKIGAE